MRALLRRKGVPNWPHGHGYGHGHGHGPWAMSMAINLNAFKLSCFFACFVLRFCLSGANNLNAFKWSCFFRVGMSCCLIFAKGGAKKKPWPLAFEFFSPADLSRRWPSGYEAIQNAIKNQLTTNAPWTNRLLVYTISLNHRRVN